MVVMVSDMSDTGASRLADTPESQDGGRDRVAGANYAAG